MRSRNKEVPSRWSLYGRRLAACMVWAGLAGTGYWWGRYGTATRATAQTPLENAAQVQQSAPPATAGVPSDYSRRVVAYIYGTIPITREELGEYLIARYGRDKLPLLINKRIIEHHCQEKGVSVTAAEVDAALAADVADLGINEKQFVDNVLKQYKKTLYEWKEDVIRPRLLMTKLCRARVTVTPEDIAQAYESHYGEKVDCKVIIWKAAEKNRVMHDIWAKIRSSEEEFERCARSQFEPTLASVGGHIPPVGRHTLTNEKLEKVVFNLRPNEVSEVVETKEGVVVVKCLARVPADTTVTLETVRTKLEKEVFDKKVQQEIPALFQEIQAVAQPKDLLKAPSAEDLKASAAELLKETEKLTASPTTGVPTPVPHAAVVPPKAPAMTPMPQK